MNDMEIIEAVHQDLSELEFSAVTGEGAVTLDDKVFMLGMHADSRIQ